MSSREKPHAGVGAHPISTDEELVEGASTGALWIESKKQVMTDCIAKNMEATQKVKEICDKKFVDVEARISKCEATLQGIMESSHNIVKASTETMSTMVRKLEKSHMERTVVDVDRDVAAGAEESGPLGKHTRTSLKKRFTEVPPDILELKNVAKKMHQLSADVAENLKNLG